MSSPAAAVPRERMRAGERQAGVSPGGVANGTAAGSGIAIGPSPPGFAGGVGSGVIVTAGVGDELALGLGGSVVLVGLGLMTAGVVGCVVAVVGGGLVVGGVVDVCPGMICT